jgi:ABC-type oligopeptide transport system ATPase subunit
MHLGRNLETGARGQVSGAPRHPYTQALLSAAVVPDLACHLVGSDGEPARIAASAPDGARSR